MKNTGKFYAPTKKAIDESLFFGIISECVVISVFNIPFDGCNLRRSRSGSLCPTKKSTKEPGQDKESPSFPRNSLE
jgi:hypothetical protein